MRIININLNGIVDPNSHAYLTATIVSKPSHGTSGKINEDTGAVTYIPTSAFGTDKFGFKVNDGKANSTSMGIVTVNIIEKPPKALNGSATTQINRAININLNGYVDPNSHAYLTATIVSKPSHGTLGKINEDTGAVTYSPNQGFSGDDNFTFKVNDTKLTSNTATVHIKVNGG